MNARSHADGFVETQAPTLAHRLDELARGRGVHGGHDGLAYVFLGDGEHEDSRLTYAQLATRARAIGRHLLDMARPGDRALLMHPPGMSFIEAFFGCLMSGIVAVPAYPPRRNQSLDRLGAIVGGCAPRLILVAEEQRGQLEPRFANAGDEGVAAIACAQVIATDTIASRAVTGTSPTDMPPPAVRPDDLAFLQFTSGSTGDPKGVMVHHGALMANQRLIRHGMGHDADTVFAGWLPLYHDMGLVGNLLQPLYLGIPSVLMAPAAFLQKPMRWLRAISDWRATTAGSPDFGYDLCVRRFRAQACAGLDLSSWTVAYNGAEPVRADTLARFARTFAPYGFRAEAFYPCYGMAETTLMITGGRQGVAPPVLTVDGAALDRGVLMPPPPADMPAATLTPPRRLVGCGQAGPGLDIAIADPETGRRLGDGRIGEIRVAGSSLARGYWQRPEQTAQVFGQPLTGAADTGRAWLKTGDLGAIMDGELYVTGRIKDLIIIRGRNHYPQDVEAAITNACPDLAAGAAAAVSVETGGTEIVVAMVEVERERMRRFDGPMLYGDAMEAVAAALELRLDRLVVLRPNTILKTSSGKIRRREMRRRLLDGTLDVLWDSAAPRPAVPADARTEVMADIVAEGLGR